jgi:ATP-dependent Clp protease protease subunit
MFINIDSDLRIYGRMLAESTDLPSVIYVNDITESALKNFTADFQHIYCSGQDVIPIMIDSFGGDPLALSPMLDMIAATKRPIATIAIGKAMSCGAWLLASGTPGYRYAYPSARIMIHSLAGHLEGHIEQLSIMKKELDDISFNLNSAMDKFCKKPKGHTTNKFKALNGLDWYLDATSAKMYGIVDHIGIPQMSTSINMTTTLER